MPYYRKLLIIISNSLFRFILFFTVSIIAASLLYTDKNYIPSVLVRNDAYNKVIPAILESNKNQSLTVGGEITLEDEEVQKIISDSFRADEIKVYTEEILASTYSWLEQDASKIEFNIDLTSNRQRLAESLSFFAINRLQSLPLCTGPVPQIDPFSASCQPTLIDYAVERKDLENQLLTESGFLEDPIITEEIITGDEGSSAFEEQYRLVPTFYSLARFVPLYVSLLLIFLALIVIFSSSTRKIGMRKIGRGMVGAGSSLIIFTVIFSYILPSMTGSLPVFQSNGGGIDGLLSDVSIDLSRDYSLMIIKLSAPIIIVGYGLIIYARRGKNKRNYKNAKLKSGVVSSNVDKKKKPTSKKRTKPPIQSSEASDTKPKRKLKNKKYRKIPKKEI